MEDFYITDMLGTKEDEIIIAVPIDSDLNCLVDAYWNNGIIITHLRKSNQEELEMIVQNDMFPEMIGEMKVDIITAKVSQIEMRTH